MSGFIDQHKSVAELYADLCIRFRGLHFTNQSPNAICSWCGGWKEEHVPSGACSNEAASKYFTPVLSEGFTATEKALSLIEELIEL